jgi:hypothetical protein
LLTLPLLPVPLHCLAARLHYWYCLLLGTHAALQNNHQLLLLLLLLRQLVLQLGWLLLQLQLCLLLDPVPAQTCAALQLPTEGWRLLQAAAVRCCPAVLLAGPGAGTSKLMHPLVRCASHSGSLSAAALHPSGNLHQGTCTITVKNCIQHANSSGHLELLPSTALAEHTDYAAA